MFKGGPGDYNRVMIWTSGSLWGAGWAYVRALVPVILLGGAYIFYKGRMLDALSFSDETAIGWGISIERERKKMLLCAVILAGASTAFAGNIGFIGLLAPHAAKKVVGNGHRVSLFLASLIAAVILDTKFKRRTGSDSGALASWETNDTGIGLWMKPRISRHGAYVAGSQLTALVAETLTPDIVLSASRGGLSAYAIIDAKSWESMLPEQALEQSAKYLYGIRYVDEPDLVPAMAGVDLITCAAPPAIGNSDASLVHVISATPTRGLEVLEQRIEQIVRQLLASLAEREYSASEF